MSGLRAAREGLARICGLVIASEAKLSLAKNWIALSLARLAMTGN
jgi:hypothetical protein